MGAKKKGMANRLAKMSDEERAKYLQHRADIEEESRRRKEQLISTFLKNKLKKEDAFSRLNVAKLNQNWHQVLRKFKCKNMKEDIEYLRDRMVRILELKDRAIKRLLLELEEAEEQYNNNFQWHLNHITNMIDFGYKSLDEMHEDYDVGRDKMIECATRERGELLKSTYDEIVHLKTITYEQEFIARKTLRESYEYYFQRSDDVIRENKREFEDMRRTKEAMIGDIWQQIASTLRHHVEVSDTRRAHLAELQSLDAESAVEIARNEENMKRQEADIVILEKQYEDLKISRKDDIKLLTKTVASFKNDFLHVKVKLKKELATDESQLVFLSQCSNSSIEYLEKLNDKGEKLLQLMQICRKYETQEEKVLRFASSDYELDKYLTFIDAAGEGQALGITQQEKPAEAPSSSATGSPEIPADKRRPKTSRIRHVKSAPASSSSSSINREVAKISRLIEKRIATKAITSSSSVGSDSVTSHKSSRRISQSATASSSSFPSSSSSIRASRRISKSSGGSTSLLGLQPREVNVMRECFEVVEQMDGIWNVYNKVLISCMGMRDERKRLVQENEDLKGVLRAVMESAALQRISDQFQVESSEEYLRNIHSADKMFNAFNVKLLT